MQRITHTQRAHLFQLQFGFLQFASYLYGLVEPIFLSASLSSLLLLLLFSISHRHTLPSPLPITLHATDCLCVRWSRLQCVYLLCFAARRAQQKNAHTTSTEISDSSFFVRLHCLHACEAENVHKRTITIRKVYCIMLSHGWNQCLHLFINDCYCERHKKLRRNASLKSKQQPRSPTADWGDLMTTQL